MENSSKLLFLSGKGDFLVEVVGESYYRENLKFLCGGSLNKTPDKMYTAELICEDGNIKDENAVKVSIFENIVGHLSREFAKFYRSVLKKNNIYDNRITCYAKIVGGWQGEDGFIGGLGVRLDLPVEYIGLVKFDFDVDDTFKFIFELEHLDKDELKECQVGQKVNFWIKPSGLKQIYVYRSGSCGGAGYLGKVPLKYYNVIDAHLRKRLPFYAYIYELKKRVKIECEMFSEKYVQERARIELSKKYRPRKRLSLFVELPKNTSLKPNDKIYLKYVSIESRAQHWNDFQITFLNDKDEVVAKKSYPEEKAIKLLRAQYSGYEIDITVANIEFPDSTRVPFVDYIKATVNVEFS